MNTERIAEIARVTDAATPGPWVAHFSFHGDPAVMGGPDGPLDVIAVPSTAPDDYGKANNEFIAMARTAIPDLLDALQTRDEEITELRAALAHLVGKITGQLGGTWGTKRSIDRARVLLARGNTDG